jgi:hypothetical protein
LDAEPNDAATNTVVADSTMGMQSQLRQGAIKKCKKMGTKIKANRAHKQNAIGGGVAFAEALHCSVCKVRRLNARGNAVNIHHGPHHKKCGVNRKTRGLSAMTVFVNREAARNVAINTAPMALVLGPRLATEAAEAGANIARFFAPCPQLNPPSTNVAQLPLGTNEAVAWRNQQGGHPQKFQQKTRSIREVLDETPGSTTNQDQEFKWLGKTKHSKAITLAVDTVLKKFEHRKSSKIEDPLPITSNFSEAMEMHHSYFPPGTCTFTFPPDMLDDGSAPSPHCHLVAGESFVHLDWKLLSPKVELCCFNCMQAGVAKEDCFLKHDRTNCSKSKSLFPSWTESGRPTLCVLMNYKCEACGSAFHHAIAIDWTFQVVKNCDSPGAKAMFTDERKKCLLWLLLRTPPCCKCPTCWLKLFKKEELISNRRFFVMTHAHTTKIFGEDSSEPTSSFDSVCFTFCTGLWTLSTQNVRRTGRASFP